MKAHLTFLLPNLAKLESDGTHYTATANFIIMLFWSPWGALSRGGSPIKLTFITLVLIAALASMISMKEKVKQATTESSVPLSLAERFVIEGKSASATQNTRRAQENKRKDRKRTAADNGRQGNMITNAAMAGNGEDCTSYFCQKKLSDSCLLEYKVNMVVPATISMVLVCDGSRWLGIGFSESGKMMQSEAVLGSPTGSIPQKYSLGGYDQYAVVPMEEKAQTLTDASINYYDADDVTVLKFTKVMNEHGEIEIKPGKNTFLFAKGIFEDLNYHQERDTFELLLPNFDDIVEIAPPLAVDGEEEFFSPPVDDGEEESSEKKRKNRDKDTEEEEEEGLSTSVNEPQDSKRKQQTKEDDDSQPSSEKQSQESQNKNKQQGRGEGKLTIAERFAARGPIELRPLKEMRPQLSPPAPAIENIFPYPFPDIRFMPWERLSSQTKEIMTDNFGYSKRDWPSLGQNENERMICSQLTDTQRQAMQLLGWNCDMWNCFINHYKSFDTVQLEEHGLLGHVDVVRNAWIKPYNQLTEEELTSATRLCFTELMWDYGFIGGS